MPALWPLTLALLSPAPSSLHTTIQRAALKAHAYVGVACSFPGVALDCNPNATQPFPMQSVYKLPIAIAVLYAVEQGRLTLSQPIRFLPSDSVRPGIHSPLRDAHPHANVDVPIQELLRLSVSESDGTASDILLRTLGGPAAANAYIQSLGIPSIHIQDTERSIGQNICTQCRNSATPQSLVALLRLLADRSPLTSEHTALLLYFMTDTTTGDHRIKELLPPGTAVAQKTGTSGTDHGITHPPTISPSSPSPTAAN